MATILCLETATPVCSVGLWINNEVVALRELESPNSHSSVITQFIEEVLQEAGITLANLSAVAVSAGPGSYTGLRIGVSTAKGLCYAQGLPLIAISPLQAMASGYKNRLPIETRTKALFCPMIDARRMEVFTAVYDADLQTLQSVSAEIIDENSLAPFLDQQIVYFLGDGATKCMGVIAHKNARFPENTKPSAAFIGPLAEAKFQNNEFVDVAYFEPFYLKDFVAGKPKVKGLYS